MFFLVFFFVCFFCVLVSFLFVCFFHPQNNKAEINSSKICLAGIKFQLEILCLVLALCLEIIFYWSSDLQILYVPFTAQLHTVLVKTVPWNILKKNLRRVIEAYTPFHYVSETKLELLPGLLYDPKQGPHTKSWKLIRSFWTIQAITLVKNLASHELEVEFFGEGLITLAGTCQQFLVSVEARDFSACHLCLMHLAKKKKTNFRKAFAKDVLFLWLSKILLLHIQRLTC